MTVILFFVSMFVIALVSGLKAIDLKVKKINFLSYLYEKCDSKILETINFLIKKYNWSKKVSNIFVFEFLPSLFYEQLVKLKDEVARKYYQNGDRFRGRRVLRSNGSVSFFLERLGEER